MAALAADAGGWAPRLWRWPARAIRRVDGDTPGRNEFAAPSGQSHIYDNFPGVRFKAVTFAHDKGGQDFVLVLGRPPAKD